MLAPRPAERYDPKPFTAIVILALAAIVVFVAGHTYFPPTKGAREVILKPTWDIREEQAPTTSTQVLIVPNHTANAINY